MHRLARRSARWHREITVGLVCLLGVSGCTELSWEDYMAAGHDAVQDNRYQEAELFFLTAVDLADYFEQDDLRRAVTLNNLGNLFVLDDRFVQAEELFHRATLIIEHVQGPHHPDLATQVDTVARVYAQQDIHSEAALLFERAATIREAEFGLNHLTTIESMSGLAGSYYHQGFHSEAEALYERIIPVLEEELEPTNVRLADVYDDYAGVLRATNRGVDALRLETQARSIRSLP